MMKGKERGIYKRGKMFWIAYTSSDGKSIRQSAGTREDARRMLSEIRSKNRKPSDLIHLQSKITFKELFEAYRNSPEAKRFVLQFETEYMKYFGNRKLREISRSNLYSFKDEQSHREKKYGGRIKAITINRALAGLRRLLNFAVNRELLEVNPFPKPKSDLFASEKENRARKVSFTEEEISSICSLLKNPTIRAMTRCSYLSGMRAGELLNMEWSHWSAKKIRLPKTKSGEEQEVTINDEMIAILNSLPRLGKYVFCKSDGSKLSWWHYFTPFKRAMRKVIGDREGRWNFHTLRHSCGSNLHAKGVKLEVISDQLRHSDLRVTRDFYVKPSPEIQQEAVEQLSTSQTLHNLVKNQEGEEWVQ